MGKNETEYRWRGTKLAELRILEEFEVEAFVTTSCIEPKGQSKDRNGWRGTYKSQEQNENRLEENTCRNVVDG